MKSSCSWCHTMNSTAFEYCATCGHQAHEARMNCLCAQCAPARHEIDYPEADVTTTENT